MKAYYKIDFSKLLVELLPTRWRKPKFMTFTGIIALQLQNIHFEFTEFINDFEQGAKTQKCYLEAEINKWFDPYKKRIILRTFTPDYDSLLLWKDEANKPWLISEETPHLLQPEGNLLQNQISFEVVLPIGFHLTSSQTDLMKSILDKNKLPSKTYTIINE